MKPRTSAERTQYLRRALKINPMFQAEELLLLRERYHRTLQEPKTQTSSATASEELRDQNNREIQAIRDEFWQLELNSLSRRLKKLDLDKFPDLQNAADRLLMIAAHRNLLPVIAQQREFDPVLFKKLKQILVSSPRDAGSIKEDALLKLMRHERISQVQKFVKKIKRIAPEIYDLEADWFNNILAIKQQADQESVVEVASDSSDSGGFGWATWIIIVIILRVLVRLLRD